MNKNKIEKYLGEMNPADSGRYSAMEENQNRKQLSKEMNSLTKKITPIVKKLGLNGTIYINLVKGKMVTWRMDA